MEYIATQKYLRLTPRKVRVVAQMVKKLSPARAIEVLPFVGKGAAVPLQKVIKTAVANAQSQGAHVDRLVISEIQIGDGPRLKRWKAASRGRVKPFARDMSHIRVVLKEVEATQENKKALKLGSSDKNQSPKSENVEKKTKSTRKENE